MKLNSTLLKSTVVAALGGLLFGFDTAVIAGATQPLKDLYGLTPFWLGFTVAAALVGTVIGSMLAGIPGDKLGRRASLRWMAILYVISALGCAFAWNWSALVFFRFIGGLGIGGSSVLGPMYIAEIAPAKWRGRLVGTFQFNVVFGILLAYFSNYLIGTMGFGDAEWRWKLGVSGLPALLFLALLFGIPESPRWLAKKGRTSEAGDLQSVAVGATNLIFTVIAMSVIDKLGRKTLLLVGSVGTCLCLAGVAGIFLTNRHQELLVWMLIGFIAFFAFSQGAVIWVYLSEVFPNRVRAKGQSLGSFSHWIMNALISWTFPLMAASSGGYPFAFFSAMMVVQFFVVLAFYPETKGISLEEMQKKLKIA